ncbi:MAG: ATP-dependent DNA helicase [Burkholderiales bacterium]
MQFLDSVFAANGALAQSIPAYRPRIQQLEMAQAVQTAIRDSGLLIAEAGTGTGKTFAYLVPALSSGGKVIISTGTKTLQDQLFMRDIPTVRDALKAPVTVSLLKGRANYICHYHLERAKNDGRFGSREDTQHIQKIVRFAKASQSGDKGECVDVPENAGVWPLVTSTRENCLGSECPNHKECFVLEARKRALASDVVVVNHHLFFADVMLRDEGMAELLPACNTVIFDEAHQLPETASLFFGESIASSQLIDLARDTRAEAVVSAKDFKHLPDACLAVDKAVRDLRLTLQEDAGRLNAQQVRGRKGFEDALDTLQMKLSALVKVLESQAHRDEGLENCFKRAQELSRQIKHWRGAEEEGSIRWLEIFGHTMQLNTTPLDIAEIFRKQVQAQKRAWIFTSATLSVKGDFSHYQSELGLQEAQSASWDSPFDFGQQALLYVPENMPEPNTPAFTEAVVEAAFPVIEASGGRAFLLFTSLRAMRLAHELLQEKFEKNKIAFPLLLQGQGSRTELLERFRKLGNAVLIASQSFWEGVDVKGDALSLVVIDKLPFAPPDDPVLAARIEQINKAGRNAFMEYQLPAAVINLKQGAGRLIRDEADRGVLMICDPRLLSKPYGKRIWQSLPPMKRTRSVQEVKDFFAQVALDQSAA